MLVVTSGTIKILQAKVDHCNRISSLCKQNLGDDFHASMTCNHQKMKEIGNKYIKVCYEKEPNLFQMNEKDEFIYLLKGNKKSLPFIGKFMIIS